MEIQEYNFNRLADYFYIYAKERYEKAVKLVGVETFLYKQIYSKELNNISIFEKPYELIAAYYRFYNLNKINLFENIDDYEEIVSNEWISFFQQTAKKIVQFDHITLTILELVINQNYKDNINLLDKLILQLENYFDDSFITACKEYRCN